MVLINYTQRKIPPSGLIQPFLQKPIKRQDKP